MNAQELKWEVRKRLEEIERCLWWTGRLGRANLIDKFGISPQQASADISFYQELAPGNTLFNRSGRYYEPTQNFLHHFIVADAADYAVWRDKMGGEVALVPMPLRSTPLPALRPMTMAIHQKKSVHIEYQSMSSAKKTHRRITPHSLVFDGYRYHARSYCHSRNEFRDFVLGRISNAGQFDDPGPGKESDDAWNTLVILRLGSASRSQPRSAGDNSERLRHG